jgi:multidrug resistance efflux pump
MDFPGADTIADRLAVNNPLAKVDDKSKVAPRIQMEIQQLSAQNQQLQQAVQELQMVIKQRQDIEGVKQDAETKRKLMDVTAKANDTEMREETSKRNTDADNETKIQIEELKATVALLLARMSGENTKLVNAETIERAV